jgi:hypothetical protein
VIDHRRRALAVATGAWLLGWYWKVSFYVAHLREAAAHPIDLASLPSVLRAPWLAVVAYALPAAAATLALCALIACAHVELFSDATFVTSFWAALWLAWLAAAPDDELARHGPRLARATVALVFLGGAVGKLTGAYASGEAFYHLYFLQKDTWPYPALRAALEPGALRALATWFSRAVIAGELALAFGPIVPHRSYVWGACVIMLGMVVISTFYLLSVVAPLVGVLVASRVLAAAPSR